MSDILSFIYKDKMLSTVNSVIRRFLVSPYSPNNRSIIVTEYPKSGGTWLAQMVSDLLQVPFPRNCIPKSNQVILHGHYLNEIEKNKTVVLWRDGRDVLVSWYFHCLFYNNVKNKKLVDKVRSDLSFSDYDNVRANLVAFIEYSFVRQKHPSFSWSVFVENWYAERKVCHVRYEDLRSEPVRSLFQVIEFLTLESIPRSKIIEVVEKYSFEKQSGRKPGMEQKNSFMRKGLVGDWKNQFNSEAKEVFDFYAGEALVRLGYEDNNDWVGRD